MKYIILVPDGVSDHPCEELNGKTPLEAANIPNLNWFAKTGRMGAANTIPSPLQPGSDVGHLSILGYDPKSCYTGRAPIEAASMGIELQDGEVAFRMNLVTEADGKLIDYSAGHISTKEAHTLVNFLKSRLDSERVTLYPGIQYRHIAVIRDAGGVEGLSAKCTPAHDIQGKPIDEYWPKGSGAELLKKLMEEARILLSDHEVNRVRLDLKENPANMIWFWGQGVMPHIQLFKEKYGKTGSLISAVDLVKGIGYLAGLEVLNVPGMTGYVDTNYEGKVEYGLNSLKSQDLTYIHVEATDEAGHEGNVKLKIMAIEDFDKRVVGPVKEYVKSHPDTRVLIMPDHSTSCKVKTHVRGNVPFIIAGKGIEPSGADEFTETAASRSLVQVGEAHTLMGELLA
ncbi:MAG: cofactor-independent phosphoglycerate mutase [Candidatus Omnitrophica bacterium]|nr:cofactor-independent phosphoglycerate mutase [Candidatus Omnitrophota bacterium]